MFTFLLWCVLFIMCWPLAILALVAYPFIWLHPAPIPHRRRRGPWSPRARFPRHHAPVPPAGCAVPHLSESRDRIRISRRNRFGERCAASLSAAKDIAVVSAIAHISEKPQKSCPNSPSPSNFHSPPAAPRSRAAHRPPSVPAPLPPAPAHPWSPGCTPSPSQSYPPRALR